MSTSIAEAIESQPAGMDTGRTVSRSCATPRFKSWRRGGKAREMSGPAVPRSTSTRSPRTGATSEDWLRTEGNSGAGASGRRADAALGIEPVKSIAATDWITPSLMVSPVATVKINAATAAMTSSERTAAAHICRGGNPRFCSTGRLWLVDDDAGSGPATRTSTDGASECRPKLGGSGAYSSRTASTAPAARTCSAGSGFD